MSGPSRGYTFHDGANSVCPLGYPTESYKKENIDYESTTVPALQDTIIVTWCGGQLTIVWTTASHTITAASKTEHLHISCAPHSAAKRRQTSVSAYPANECKAPPTTLSCRAASAGGQRVTVAALQRAGCRARQSLKKASTHASSARAYLIL